MLKLLEIYRNYTGFYEQTSNNLCYVFVDSDEIFICFIDLNVFSLNSV